MKTEQYYLCKAAMRENLKNRDTEGCVSILNMYPYEKEELSKFLTLAIAYRMDDLIEELFARGVECDQSVAYIASIHCNKTVLERCLASEIEIDQYSYEVVATSGDKELLEWMIECYTYRTYNWYDCICIGAAVSGQVELLKWAIEQGYPINSSMESAAIMDQLECLELIYSKTLTWERLDFVPSYEGTRKFLHDNGYPGKWISSSKGWGCSLGKCLFCEARKKAYIELWQQDKDECDNVIQWMPEEVALDILGMLMPNSS